ncbi:hypothetical protein ADL15_20590 [Actinoplanes awajinensis subsp. mycoplanecinus]|uniref:Uncharacterized protein n=1 Tax=Actinoplanes awajinensis subsp. mycoplanecinus TaxID=135947 RepID=A0A117MRJ7_9ACTN|nr:hypothetical protein ADL15_20590 [Actinoplanes awajinensis subsp. mycoplanecinus]
MLPSAGHRMVPTLRGSVQRPFVTVSFEFFRQVITPRKAPVPPWHSMWIHFLFESIHDRQPLG